MSDILGVGKLTQEVLRPLTQTITGVKETILGAEQGIERIIETGEIGVFASYNNTINKISSSYNNTLFVAGGLILLAIILSNQEDSDSGGDSVDNAITVNTAIKKVKGDLKERIEKVEEKNLPPKEHAKETTKQLQEVLGNPIEVKEVPTKKLIKEVKSVKTHSRAIRETTLQTLIKDAGKTFRTLIRVPTKELGSTTRTLIKGGAAVLIKTLNVAEATIKQVGVILQQIAKNPKVLKMLIQSIISGVIAAVPGIGTGAEALNLMVGAFFTGVAEPIVEKGSVTIGKLIEKTIDSVNAGMKLKDNTASQRYKNDLKKHAYNPAAHPRLPPITPHLLSKKKEIEDKITTAIKNPIQLDRMAIKHNVTNPQNQLSHIHIEAIHKGRNLKTATPLDSKHIGQALNIVGSANKTPPPPGTMKDVAMAIRDEKKIAEHEDGFGDMSDKEIEDLMAEAGISEEDL